MGKLEEITTEIASVDNVKGIVIFGSYVTSLSPRDIDVLVVLGSDSFLTNPEDYKQIASSLFKHSIFPSLDITIKTDKEFEITNIVSLSRGFLQHLNNVGNIIYDEIGLEKNILKRLTELKSMDGYWNELGDSLSIRKEYLSSLLGKDYSLSARFYQQAVREVMKLEFPEELDTKDSIIQLFYDTLFEKVDYASFFGESPEFTVYRVLNAFRYNNPSVLKDEIEKAMFAMNSYLVSE